MLIELKWIQVLEKQHQSSQGIIQVHLILLVFYTACVHFLIRATTGSTEHLQEELPQVSEICKVRLLRDGRNKQQISFGKGKHNFSKDLSSRYSSTAEDCMLYDAAYKSGLHFSKWRCENKLRAMSEQPEEYRACIL